MKKKKVTYPTFIEENKTYMLCKHCQVEYVVVDEDVVAVTCSHCVQKRCLSLKPIESFYSSRRVKTGRPSGWQWMNEFVDKDGNVFHKGKEQPKLKGTLSPTKVKPPKKRKKLTKDEKMFKQAKAHKAKMKAKNKQLRKAIKKQKDFLNGKVGK